MQRFALRVAALPRAWVAVLLLVAALDLAVVGAAGAGGPAARTGALAPLVAALDGDVLVRDGVLVAAPEVRTADGHALVIDPAAATATADPGPGTRSALVLAGDGLALVDRDARWTVPYSGSLDAADLQGLLAGWEQAQRGPAVMFATLTGVLATVLGTAVLGMAVLMTSRAAGWGGLRRRLGRLASLHGMGLREAVTWWSASLATAGTASATVRLVSGGDGPPPALALAATFAIATVGTGLLAVAAQEPSTVPAAPALAP